MSAGPALRYEDRRPDGPGRANRVPRLPRRGRRRQTRARPERQGGAASYSRKGIDELTEYVMHDFGAKGLAWFKVEADGTLASPIAKNFEPAILAKISERIDAAPGDLLLIVADEFEVTCKALYGLRKRLGEQLKLYEPGSMHFSWVVEFPMFAYDDESKGWAAMHHPFTAPRTQDRELLANEPGKCRAGL